MRKLDRGDRPSNLIPGISRNGAESQRKEQRESHLLCVFASLLAILLTGIAERRFQDNGNSTSATFTGNCVYVVNTELRGAVLIIGTTNRHSKHHSSGNRYLNRQGFSRVAAFTTSKLNGPCIGAESMNPYDHPGRS
jgi:hypothetical protein